MEEMTLISAARMMKKEALTEIFDRYASSLYSYAFRLCRDPLVADHIVGDVFAKLLDHLAVGKGPTSNLRSYLYETAYHLIVDEIRYAQRRIPLEVVDFLPHDRSGPASRWDDQIMFECLLKALHRDLTEDQWHVLVLRILEGFSLRDTAAILGKKVGNIKVIQNRAIGILRQSIPREAMGSLPLGQ